MTESESKRIYIRVQKSDTPVSSGDKITVQDMDGFCKEG